MTTQPSALSAPAADERSLEELLARVPGELLLAEHSSADCMAAERLEDVEHDFWMDPCHFLRRACQVADYGAPGAVPPSSGTQPGASR